METIVTEVWKILLGTAGSAIVLYVGYINKMRTQISVMEEKTKQFDAQCTEVSRRFEEVARHYAVLEEKTQRMEQRQDNHSKKNDEIIKLITDFKIEMVKQLGNVAAEVGKVASDINNLNRRVNAKDDLTPNK